MSEINFEESMRQAVTDISKHGKEYAEYAPMANHLDELKKTILASEIIKAGEVPFWKAEAKARTSEAYILHLDGLKIAEERKLKAQAMLEAAKAKFEAIRSLCSLRKQEINSFQG